VEAPLPAFTFGRLFYFSAPTNPDAPLAHERMLPTWVGSAVALGQPARLLEFMLRECPQNEIAVAAGNFAIFWRADGNSDETLLRTLASVFHDVSLSPWTDFVERVLRALSSLEVMTAVSAENALDLESYFLRLVCRHLTAYDLVTFHHRGANYPDALLLDAVLNDYLARLEKNPELFTDGAGRVRRRALRQAYLLRRQYENHPVPDVPTSPGEHQRVLPDGYPRVPEEQILNPAARKRRLYENDPLLARLSPVALGALRQSVADLAHADERQELGAAVFLDRPFGGAKAPVEPDGTPLLASLAYSRFVATRRIRRLWHDLQMPEGDVSDLELPGLPVDRIGAPSRLGTVSLGDAARAAPDFVYSHTLPGSVRSLLEWIDFGPFSERTSGRVLLARAPSGQGILVYDEQLRPFAEIVPRYEQGYVSRRGVEFPAAGVVVRESPRGEGET
jgi:hypothetical protein